MVMIKNHRSNLLYNAKKVGYSAVAAFQPENIFYITGFWGEGIALCTDNGTRLIAPKLEITRAQEQSKDCEIISSDRGSDLVSTFMLETSRKELSICTDCDDYSMIEAIRQGGGDGKKSFIMIDKGPFFQSRLIKDEDEIKAIAKVARILDNLYQICVEEIKIGLSERDLQAKLIFEAMKMGANPSSYKSTLNPLIIASGSNTSLPHAEVSDRVFSKGDMIVIDLTLRHGGYIADATRSFVLCSASAEMKKVYDIVKRSQQAGLDVLKDGITSGEVDASCRDLIDKEGYAKYFIHSTGHGIGLDVHEPPWLRTKNREIIKTNMALTIEPGIYLEDKFGVRIEDSVIINKRGIKGKAESLNKFTKDLIELD